MHEGPFDIPNYDSCAVLREARASFDLAKAWALELSAAPPDAQTLFPEENTERKCHGGHFGHWKISRDTGGLGCSPCGGV